MGETLYTFVNGDDRLQIVDQGDTLKFKLLEEMEGETWYEMPHSQVSLFVAIINEWRASKVDTLP